MCGGMRRITQVAIKWKEQQNKLSKESKEMRVVTQITTTNIELFHNLSLL